MKAYPIATGSVFGLIVVAHLWRMVAEPRLAAEPWYLAVTAASTAFAVWALRLLQRSPRP
jgi:uncharacterized membrane protein